MTVKFPSYANRQRVAEMLEKPIRALVDISGSPLEAMDDVHAILAELDRIDRVREATLSEGQRQDEARRQARRDVVAEQSTPIEPKTVKCEAKTLGDVWRAIRGTCTRWATRDWRGDGPRCDMHAERIIQSKANTLYLDREGKRTEITEAEQIISDDMALRSRRRQEERADRG